MKKIIILLLLFLFSSASYGNDLRAVMKKAEEEYKKALELQAESKAEILKNRTKLADKIKDMEVQAPKPDNRNRRY